MAPKLEVGDRASPKASVDHYRERLDGCMGCNRWSQPPLCPNIMLPYRRQLERLGAMPDPVGSQTPEKPTKP
jgi:hypothetical protein